MARHSKLEREYAFLVVDVANYLDYNTDHFRHLETKYCKFTLYADALKYRERPTIDSQVDHNVSFADNE